MKDLDRTRERIGERLHELREELEHGQRELAHLEENRARLRNTLMRISGAVQVLEELLAAPEDRAFRRSSPEPVAKGAALA